MVNLFILELQQICLWFLKDFLLDENKKQLIIFVNFKIINIDKKMIVKTNNDNVELEKLKQKYMKNWIQKIK